MLVGNCTVLAIEQYIRAPVKVGVIVDSGGYSLRGGLSLPLSKQGTALDILHTPLWRDSAEGSSSQDTAQSTNFTKIRAQARQLPTIASGNIDPRAAACAEWSKLRQKVNFPLGIESRI